MKIDTMLVTLSKLVPLSNKELAQSFTIESFNDFIKEIGNNQEMRSRFDYNNFFILLSKCRITRNGSMYLEYAISAPIISYEENKYISFLDKDNQVFKLDLNSNKILCFSPDK